MAPGVVKYTGELLFHDLWLRPALAPRDRSLVTVAALIALRHVAQSPYHLNRAMDNGLTNAQASEVLTHQAFYAGWPNVMSAIPVAKRGFRGHFGDMLFRSVGFPKKLTAVIETHFPFFTGRRNVTGSLRTDHVGQTGKLA